MNKIQFFFNEPENRIDPAKNKYDIQKQFICTVLFSYVCQFMSKNLLPRLGMDIDSTVPENEFEKRKWCALGITFHKYHVINVTTGVGF